jgi:hypothetical protein
MKKPVECRFVERIDAETVRGVCGESDDAAAAKEGYNLIVVDLV